MTSGCSTLDRAAKYSRRQKSDNSCFQFDLLESVLGEQVMAKNTKHTLCALFLVSLMSCSGKSNLTGTLAGSNEVPAISSPGTGTVTVQVSSDKSTLTYSISVSGTQGQPAAAYFYYGNAGQQGTQVQPPLVQASVSTYYGSLTAANFTPVTGLASFADLVSAVQNGQIYVNILTNAYPQGEVRAQLQ